MHRYPGKAPHPFPSFLSPFLAFLFFLSLSLSLSLSLPLPFYPYPLPALFTQRETYRMYSVHRITLSSLAFRTRAAEALPLAVVHICAHLPAHWPFLLTNRMTSVLYDYT